MAVEQYFEEAVIHDPLSGEGKNSWERWQTSPDAVTGSDDNPSGVFDCNICLDCVQDPVVTLCGHLYCWPCIYKWLHFQTISNENQDQKQQQCPVCKAEVSHTTLIPLYGRGLTSMVSRGQTPHFGVVVPKRALGPMRGVGTVTSPTTTNGQRFRSQLHHHDYSNQPQIYYPQQGGYPASLMLGYGDTRINIQDPVTRIFSDTVYRRLLGNSNTSLYTHPNSYNLAGSTNPRIRRHIMQADTSLSRISFFLFCCILFCLALF